MNITSRISTYDEYQEQQKKNIKYWLGRYPDSKKWQKRKIQFESNSHFNTSG
jgi:hypothetical protein